MNTPRLADLCDLEAISRASGVSARDIEAYVNATNQADWYTRLRIPKRGPKRAGQFRIVHKVRHEWLAQLHRAVAMMVSAGVTFGTHVQGFVQHRSIRTNAIQHLGAARILHGDIQGFFDAITTAQVRGALLTLGTPTAMAALLARACTIDGYLRQGTRCSPALANLVCRPLDLDLLSLAAVHKSVYTRYADDLTFSGPETPRSEAVQAVLEQHGFTLRDGRCSVQRKGCAQFVTGLHVGDAAQPRLPRQLKRRLRLILHFVAKFGTDGHFTHPGKTAVADDALALAGMLRYVQSIEPQLAKRLRSQYHAGSQLSWRARSAAEEDDAN